jgi:SOS-response transcriptional repressor LexA
MTFGKRLREAREKSGKSQEAVADLFGISRASVAQWESGDETRRTTPEVDKLARLAKLLNVSLDWLLTGREFNGAMQATAEYHHHANVEGAPDARAVPLISWVQAGRTEPVEDPYHAGDSEKPIYTTRRLSPAAYALRIRGDSMEPRFQDGDVIIVDPAIGPKHGSFVVVRFDSSEEATFKQLTVDAGRQYLKPLNPRYPIIEIDQHATLCGTWVQTIVDGG